MRKILFLAAVSLVLTLAVAGVAYGVIPEAPYDTNEDCLACHDVSVTDLAPATVDFDVPGPVDYDRCATCHEPLPDLVWYWDRYVPSHYHSAFKWCGDCHNGIDGFKFTVPYQESYPEQLVKTDIGWFISGASTAATPAELHAAHTGGWVDPTFESYGCSRCHAAVTCSACHTDAVEHGDHGTSGYPAPIIRQADGAAVSEAPLSCVNASCHALAAAGTTAFTPDCVACHEPHEDISVAHYASAIAGCWCHSKDLYVEHEKYDVGCVECHEGYVSGFTAEWDKTCDACHPVKHGATGTWSGGGGQRWSGGGGRRW